MHCVQRDWIPRISFIIQLLYIAASYHGESLQQTDFYSGDSRQEHRARNMPPDYELVEPVKIDKNGNFLSYTVTHHETLYRRKRDLQSAMVHYRILQGNKDLLFNLSVSEGFLSDNYILERRTGNNSGVRITPRSGVFCHLAGTVQQRDGGSGYAAISSCNGLAGFFRLPHGDYFIEPLYNTGAAGRRHKHIMYKREAREPQRNRRDLVDTESKPCGLNGRNFRLFTPYICICIVLAPLDV